MELRLTVPINSVVREKIASQLCLCVMCVMSCELKE